MKSYEDWKGGYYVGLDLTALKSETAEYAK